MVTILKNAILDAAVFNTKHEKKSPGIFEAGDVCHKRHLVINITIKLVSPD
jgi:hypothetical protein